MKRLLIFFFLLTAVAADAQQQQEDLLDERQVQNGIQQIENANYNYFSNAGWYSTWNTLSAWYADVILTNQEAKGYLQQALNSREVYQRFDELNYLKQNGSLRNGQIADFNDYIEKIIWREIDRMYPPEQ